MRAFFVRLTTASIAACTAACAGGPPPRAPVRPGPDVVTPKGPPPAACLPVRTGGVHDFDFLAGAWTIQSRRLRVGGDGRGGWVESPASTCMKLYLGGVLDVDEYQFPNEGYSATAIRIFNLKSRQWSIYWVESRGGVLLPPVLGGFDGDRGEFYGPDELNGRPVIFRFLWSKFGPDRARWEQSYSPDGRDWKVNWVMDFTRARRADCPPA